MTVIRPNGISGVTSITSSGDTINFYKSDGTLGPELGLNVNVNSGVSTFAALNVTGVLTYEDVTSVDSVGIITARSDLSIADKIIHTGDTNTAIRFPAADTITAETSGSEALRIDSSGRLLLGTTTEGYSTSDDLTIATSGSTGMTIRSGTSNYGSIHFSDATSGTGEYAGVFEYSHASDSLAFYTSATKRLTLDSSGRLLLGTITEGHADADDLTLQAASGYTGLTLRSATDTGGAIYFSDATSGGGEYDGQIVYNQTSRTMTFATAASTKLTLKPDGLLVPKGIQASANVTPTTGNGVEIFAATSSVGQIQAYDRDNSNWNDFVIKGNTIQVHANGSERLRIDSSGTISLGNLASPASANIHLDLYCNSSYDAFIRFRDQSGAPGLIGFDHGSNAMQFYTNGASEAMRIDSSGNVVIGNTSAFTGAQFTVDNGGSGDAVIALSRSGSGQNDVAIVNSAGEFIVKNGFASNVSNLTERLRINSAGTSVFTTTSRVATFTGNGIEVNFSAGSNVFIGTQSGSEGKIGTVNSAPMSIFAGNSYTNRAELATNGDFTLHNGNLVLASGHGINFSAHGNASGMSSELLDDYEEGTWTVTLSSSGGGLAYTVANSTGYYTKIGDVVHAWWYSGVINISNNGVGSARITGLPFTSANLSQNYGVVSTTHNTAFTPATDSGYVSTNSGTIIFQPTGSTISSNWLQANTIYLMILATYKAT
tara:strand:- start:5217 stop:7358 length:2142 start_codon:yes stop_codon:yes gene_type:complete